MMYCFGIDVAMSACATVALQSNVMPADITPTSYCLREEVTSVECV